MFMPSGAVAAAGAGGVSEEELTAGDNTFGTTGFVRGLIGSLNPDDDVLAFNQYETIDTNGARFKIQILPDNIPDDDSSWRIFEITGDFGAGVVTQTYLRADRTQYFPSTGGSTRWDFTNTGDNMVDGNVYQTIIST